MATESKDGIAERAARECMVAAGIRATAEPGKVFMQATCDKFQRIVERAIAESQAPCPHLNRISSIEPDSPIFCTDCDTYLPKTELGDGEPSSFVPFPDSVKLLINLRREMLALLPRYRCGDLQGKNVEADFGSMLVRIDALLEPYDILESGAAQEVSPPSPEPGFDQATEARWQKAIYEACKKVLDHSLWHLIDGAGCDSGDALDFTLTEIRQTFNILENPEAGDTRELKAALAKAVQIAKIYHGKVPILALSEKSFQSFEEAGKELAEVERLLGEPT